MESAFARYLRHHRVEGHTDKTIQYHRDSIERSFFPFLRAAGKALTLDDLTADAVLDWVDDQRSRGLSQKTISTRVVSIKAFSKWLAAEEWVTTDRLARVKVPKVDDKPKATLAPEDVETLLRACNRASVTGRRDVAILLLLYSSGLRASEVIALQVANLDWKTSLITVRRGKGGSTPGNRG